MENIGAWIKNDWAAIVAFVDKFYAILKEIIEGLPARMDELNIESIEKLVQEMKMMIKQ